MVSHSVPNRPFPQCPQLTPAYCSGQFVCPDTGVLLPIALVVKCEPPKASNSPRTVLVTSDVLLDAGATTWPDSAMATCSLQ
jgi:hypothetical protein